jgi:hypothetical protein
VRTRKALHATGPRACRRGRRRVPRPAHGSSAPSGWSGRWPTAALEQSAARRLALAAELKMGVGAWAASDRVSVGDIAAHVRLPLPFQRRISAQIDSREVPGPVERVDSVPPAAGAGHGIGRGNATRWAACAAVRVAPRWFQKAPPYASRPAGKSSGAVAMAIMSIATTVRVARSVAPPNSAERQSHFAGTTLDANGTPITWNCRRTEGRAATPRAWVPSRCRCRPTR